MRLFFKGNDESLTDLSLICQNSNEPMRLRIIWILLLCAALAPSCKNKEALTESASPSRKGRKMLIGVEITAIRVSAVPRYSPTGEQWDPWAPLSQNPDVYVRLSQFDNIIFSSEVKEDVLFDASLEYLGGLPFFMQAYTSPLLVEVFDQDGLTGDDNMGYFTVSLMDFEKKKAVVLKNSTTALQVEMNLVWKYKE